MIQFRDNDREVEMMRQTTQDMLATEHLPDDNDLLRYLRATNYLKDDNLVGYLPAALCTYQEEPDAIELFVDTPIGARGLTMNGGPSFTYESPHRRMNSLRGLPSKVIEIDTGNVVEVQSNVRYFLPKGAYTIFGKIRRGQLSQTAFDSECERLGLAGVTRSDDYVSEDYQGMSEFSFTRVIRMAAQWASFTLKNPWDSDVGDYYPRVLNVDEAELCLQVAFDKIRSKEPYSDIAVIKSTISS